MTSIERRALVVSDKESGRTFAAIARDLGVSRKRVSEIYHRGVRERQRRDNTGTVDSDLSTRARNALRRLGVDHSARRDDVRKIIGRLRCQDVDPQNGRRVLYGCGRVTVREIEEWVQAK